MSDIYGADQATWQRVERGVKLAESMGGQGQAPRRGPRDEGGSSASTPMAVKAIIGGASSGMYSVTLYGNGYNKASTGTALLEVLEIAYGETVPVGTKVIAYLDSSVVVTGSGES